MIPLRPTALIVSILFLCLPQSYCAAQDKSKIQFVKPAPGDFKSSNGGDSTSAIILSDYGSVHFVGNDKGWFSHVFRRHTRI
ncbi:MAG TPA: hypothetical protein VHC48_23755, partial [Puia sp.]|nr:hypothetical protein [Puia sp.]